jgi:hypothetical protein
MGMRVDAHDWDRTATELSASGWSMLPGALKNDEAESLAAMYPDQRRFRSTVVMARHGFGRGEYKYFSYPLPAIVDELRMYQDLYGEHVFPLQVAFLLSAPGVDFTGGEFVLTEQRPRMQTRAGVVPLCKGDAVIFAVHHCPRRGRGVSIASTCGTA